MIARYKKQLDAVTDTEGLLEVELPDGQKEVYMKAKGLQMLIFDLETRLAKIEILERGFLFLGGRLG